jgi:hypothetical protein
MRRRHLAEGGPVLTIVKAFEDRVMIHLDSSRVMNMEDLMMRLYEIRSQYLAN